MMLSRHPAPPPARDATIFRHDAAGACAISRTCACMTACLASTVPGSGPAEVLNSVQRAYRLADQVRHAIDRRKQRRVGPIDMIVVESEHATRPVRRGVRPHRARGSRSWCPGCPARQPGQGRADRVRQGDLGAAAVGVSGLFCARCVDAAEEPAPVTARTIAKPSRQSVLVGSAGSRSRPALPLRQRPGLAGLAPKTPQ